jgi:hypothetical protein
MTLRALLLLLASVTLAFGQSNLQIHLKDGRIISVLKMRRDRDTIIATLSIPGQAGAAATQGDFGFPLSDIATLAFAKPQALDTAPELIAAGKAEEALDQLSKVIEYYEGFRDAPGSWWDEAVPLQIQALLALRRRMMRRRRRQSSRAWPAIRR